MTEAIAITLIIVAGVVALAGILFRYAYRSMIDEREREAAASPASPAINIHAIDLDPEAANRAYKNHLDFAARGL